MIARRAAWPLAFLACVVAAALRALPLGKDANWDLRNYHWYDAWALLHGRLAIDVAPAQLQTYHNPLADLPFYALVQVIDDPRWIAAWMSVPTAVAAFFLLRMLVLLFPADRSHGALWIAASAVIGLTGAMGTATWASTMNEWPGAALVMAALFFAARGAIEGEERRRFAFAVGAFLVGCAAGLKLTFAAFALGFLVGTLTFGGIAERVRRSLLAAALLGIGFLSTYGWWGWTLWTELANPFFPYYNGIFKSPWWEPINFFDAAYGPHGLGEWAFFPLYFSRHSLLTSQTGFRDYRLAALLVLAIAAWVVPRVRGISAAASADPEGQRARARGWTFLGTFTFASYAAWIVVFAQYRYLVPLEVLSGALIVACVLRLVRGNALRVGVVVLLAALLVGTTRPGTWGRIPFGERYFEITAPAIEPGALVIVGYVHPMAYAIPFFREDARFVSPANNFLQIDQPNLLERRAAEAIHGHRGPIYFLSYKDLVPTDLKTLEHFGLAIEASGCRVVPSTFDVNFLRICRMARR